MPFEVKRTFFKGENAYFQLSDFYNVYLSTTDFIPSLMLQDLDSIKRVEEDNFASTKRTEVVGDEYEDLLAVTDDDRPLVIDRREDDLLETDDDLLAGTDEVVVDEYERCNLEEHMQFFNHVYLHLRFESKVSSFSLLHFLFIIRELALYCM